MLTPLQKGIALGLAGLAGLIGWFSLKPPNGYISDVCVPGEEEILDYCNDGSIKTKRECNQSGTGWLETTYDCPPECSCTDWVEAGCTATGSRILNRTCNPSGCDYEVDTVYDPTCEPAPECYFDSNCPSGYICVGGVCVPAPPPCTCTDWEDAECATTGQRIIRRTCDPSQCDTEYDVRSDASCVGKTLTTRVFAHGVACPDATVSLLELGLTCVTGSDGTCNITAPDGQYTLCVSKPGYVEECITVWLPQPGAFSFYLEVA